MTPLPPCPQCKSEYTYEDGANYVCPECAHEWPQEEALPAGAGAVLVELASSSGHAHWNGDTLLRAALDL